MTARILDRASPGLGQANLGPTHAGQHASSSMNVVPANAPTTIAEDLTVDPVVEARAALSRSTIYVLRKLQVERDGEGIALRGSVESFYHKQLAQELVRAAVDGVKVSNLLAVVYTPKPDYLGN